MESCLGTTNLCLFWISLSTVTVSAECYCDTLSLCQPFFAKGLGYFAKVLSFCLKMPGVIHPTWQLFMAAHLIGCGSVPDLCSVLYLSLNPWEAPGWQAIAIGDVKQVATSWLQTLDSSALPWNWSLGTLVGQMLRWYWWLHYSLPWDCLLPYVLKVLCTYIAVWAGEFINTGRSGWWGYCVIWW